MKHPFLLTLVLSVFAFSSCSKDNATPEPGTYPDSAAYVITNIVENLEDETELEYIFVTDKGDKLFLADNQLPEEYDFVDGERIILYFATIEDYSKESAETFEGEAYDCDFGIRIFNVNEVITSESAIVTNSEESKAIKDHAISYIYQGLSFNDDYINLVAGLRCDKLKNVKIYLVENLSTDPEETKKNFLNLELRYDRGTEEAMGNTYDQYISLDLSEFKERLEDMDGIILRAVTLSSGTLNLELHKKEESKTRAATVATGAKF